MNLLDEEVFAVLVAFVLIASSLSATMLIIPENPERYVTLGLLDGDCEIGDYPKRILNGDNVTLCLEIGNYLGHPALFQIRFKIGTNLTLPTNSTPSSEPSERSWNLFLGNEETFLQKVSVKVSLKEMKELSERIALIFELWYFDPTNNTWSYTGRWVHLYITVSRSVIGGG